MILRSGVRVPCPSAVRQGERCQSDDAALHEGGEGARPPGATGTSGGQAKCGEPILGQASVAMHEREAQRQVDHVGDDDAEHHGTGVSVGLEIGFGLPPARRRRGVPQRAPACSPASVQCSPPQFRVPGGGRRHLPQAAPMERRGRWPCRVPAGAGRVLARVRRRPRPGRAKGPGPSIIPRPTTVSREVERAAEARASQIGL